jgi:hypothetical protein
MKKQQERMAVMERQVNRPGRRVRTSLACLLFAAGLFPGIAGARYHYTLTLAEDLQSVEVEIRLPVGDERPLEAGEGRMDALQALSGCRGERLATKAGRILTAGAEGCLRYRHPLRAQSGRRSPPVTDGVRVVTPGEWLWLPEMRSGERLFIDVNAADAIALSVPWTPVGPRRFALAPSPGSATGTAVIGRFPHPTLRVGGANLRVAVLDGPGLPVDEVKILDWLRVAAADVAGVGGEFPSPDLQVIVQTVRSRGRSPVPFGYVIRDGGEAVRFYVDASRSIADYHEDWTATHEFAHLLLPYVRSREKWVSEGFASYYQNVLLARRGAYGETEVWARLTRSFERADRVPDPPPLDRLHERPFRDMRMLVYWAGAAMALMADVQLRSRTEGAQSLDSVLGRLSRCCLPSERVWTADELFARLDELAGEAVFVPLHEEFMARRGMPDLGGLYRDLGIVTMDGNPRLIPEGRLATVREAIMARTGD